MSGSEQLRRGRQGAGGERARQKRVVRMQKQKLLGLVLAGYTFKLLACFLAQLAAEYLLGLVYYTRCKETSGEQVRNKQGCLSR